MSAIACACECVISNSVCVCASISVCLCMRIFCSLCRAAYMYSKLDTSGRVSGSYDILDNESVLDFYTYVTHINQTRT